jgi:N utilization substance protein B
MGTRRTARELALQALYQLELVGEAGLLPFDAFCAHFQVSRKAMDYAGTLFAGVRENMAEIDSLISKHAQNWRLERMSVVDRTILRIAVFELAFREDVPASVLINEAVEIAKRFSTDESGPFINGILDAMTREKGVGPESATKKAGAEN